EELSEPRSALEFTRAWRRHLPSAERRYHFLLQLGAGKLSRLSQPDLCSGLLGELMVAMEENFQPPHREEVLQILRGLAGTPRFGLHLDFLSGAERGSCRRLLARLQACAGGEAEGDGRGGVQGGEESQVPSDSGLEELMVLFKVNNGPLCPL
ncbi:hypothetical protein FKM82_030989, partial [Ascaphus truei]